MALNPRGSLLGGSASGFFNRKTFEPRPGLIPIPGPDPRFDPGYSVIGGDGKTKYVAPRLKDLNQPWQSAQGSFITISCGTRKVFCPMLWSSPFREVMIPRGLGGLRHTALPYDLDFTYVCDMIVAIGEPLIVDADLAILRVEANGTPLMNRSLKLPYTAGGAFPKIRLYNGSEDQEPDRLLVEALGEGNAPAFRGIAYIAIENLPLHQYGYQRPQISAVVADKAGEEHVKVVLSTDAETSTLNRMGVDWENAKLYTLGEDESGDRTRILEFDLEAQIYTGFIDLSSSLSGPTGNQLSTFVSVVPIPWLNMVLTCAATLTSPQSLHLVDPTSQQIIAYYPDTGGDSSFADFQLRQAVPNRLFTPDGFQTYVLVSQLAGDGMAVYRIAEPYVGIPIEDTDEGGSTGDWVIRPVRTWDNDGSADIIIPGKQDDGECHFFNYSGFNVVERIRVSKMPDTYEGVIAEHYVHIDDPFVEMDDADGDVHSIFYYAPENWLMVSQGNKLFKVNGETGSVIGETEDLGGEPIGTTNLVFWQSNFEMGYAAFRLGGVSNLIVVIDLYSMREIHRTTANDLGWSNFNFSDSRNNSFIAQDNASGDPGIFYFDYLQGTRITLKAFLEGVAIKSGLVVPDEFEVAATVDDMIDGALIFDRINLEDVLTSIGAAYRLDRVEVDGKILITRKAVSTEVYDAEIPQNELALLSNDDHTSASYQWQRQTADSLPRRIELSYLSAQMNYEPAMQAAQRSKFPADTSGSDSTLAIAIPVIITHQEAKELVTRMLFTSAWGGRTTSSFRLPTKYLDLIPSDIMTVSDGEATYPVRAVEMTVGADNSIIVGAASWLSDEPLSIEAGEGVVEDPFSPVRRGSIGMMMDMHLVNPGDDLAPAGAGVLLSLVAPSSLAPGQVEVVAHGRSTVALFLFTSPYPPR